MTKLKQLYREHTGKVSDKWSLYLEEYDRLFDPYQEHPVNLLEIGVQNGGSLDIWGKYFPNAVHLVGCDINPDCARLRYDDPRITVVVGDANKDATQECIIAISDRFDIVIDDGSHTSGDIIQSFVRYFKYLVDGGLFVAEDMHCSYWEGFDGGLYDPYSSIGFFKHLADIVNYEHWGIEKPPMDLLSGFRDKYGLDFEIEELASIHSIEFINSMCVVRKRTVAENLLGKRVIAGTQEKVVPGHFDLSTYESVAPPQTNNQWSSRKFNPLEEITQLSERLGQAQKTVVEESHRVTELTRDADVLRQHVRTLDLEITEKSQAIASLQQEIAALRSSKIWRLTYPLRWFMRNVCLPLANLMRLVFDPIQKILMVARDRKSLCASGLFDCDWYLKQYPDVAEKGKDPIRHYLMHGAIEGRNPNPLFTTSWYLAQYPDVASSGVNPLVHYLRFGVDERRNPNPVFDTSWYLMRNKDVVRTGINPLAHYLRRGIYENREPAPLFDGKWYLTQHPELASRDVNLLSHYLEHGLVQEERAFDPGILLRDVKIAVVVHLYYEDLWSEIVLFLRNIPIVFDLYVSVSEDSNVEALRKQVHRLFPAARVLTTSNAGRDIGPFLTVLPLLAASNYTAICKLHTKKGQTLPEMWRTLMLQGVLDNKYLVSGILRCFQADPDLLLVGAKDLYVSGPTLIMDNGPKLKKLAGQLYPGKPLPPEWGFFAGTMFWMGPRTLKKLLQLTDAGISLEAEDGSNDGKTAHAMERLFGLIATQENGHIGLTEVRDTTLWGSKIEIMAAPGKPAQCDVSAILKAKENNLRRTSAANKVPALRTWIRPLHKKLGVNFIGPVEFVNGVSISARGYVSCLLETDIPINVVPWRLGFERLRRTPIEYPSIDKQPINIVHLNLDLLANASLLDCAPLRELVAPCCYNVAIVYWELSSLLPEWHEIIHRFDEIWCASEFIARSVAAVSRTPVRVVRPMLEQSQTSCSMKRHDFDLPDDRFIFFYAADAGSILGRKNPLALLNAYLEEFGPDDGACCLIKIHYSNPEDVNIQKLVSMARQRPDIIFMDRALEDHEMHDLFQLIDCYVSPHRSEGLGLTILEAMRAGKPVIATPYGGAADFVTPDSAWPLEYRLVEVGEGNAPYPPHYLWADPLSASMREGMRKIFSDRSYADDLGKKGLAYSGSLFSSEKTMQVMRSELNRIWQYNPDS
uniref:rhamnan synthesis F family protein n=1 Tax=Castellaniella defragrans TaxID=75697 RepID=UPI003340CCFF